MDITEVSIIHHIGIVLASLWILSYFSICHPIAYFISLIYLYQVHEGYILKLRRKIQFEERKTANQRRVLTDSETVRWLNHTVEKLWPISMERIASEKFLLPITPWFLNKYKPWIAKKAMFESLYLGRNPPMFTQIRVLGQSSDDDHLVLELGLNFLTADDMSGILAVKLRKRLGFGIWAKLHVTGMHVEGKVLVGVKFLREWPFLERLRICFVEPPYFQMTVKPIINHGLDVTELPGIAGWMDSILAAAFEQTLVQPNMLVVDVEKFASSPTGNWFSVDEKEPIAYAKVEIMEGADMKPSDLINGLADPYVKGQLGPHIFRTQTQKKTLAPKWLEEFKIPIYTWETPNVLNLEVHDKDHFVDDTLGNCSINISDLRGEQRHVMWLALQNIKMGRLHLAVTVINYGGKEGEHIHGEEPLSKKETIDSETAKKGSDPTLSSEIAPKIYADIASETAEGSAPKTADDIEPINIEGQQKTGIWIHHPGSDVPQIWEPRKRMSKRADIQIHREDNDSMGSPRSTESAFNQNDSSSSDENMGGRRINALKSFGRNLRKIGSVFSRSPKEEDHSITGEGNPTPHVNFQTDKDKRMTVNFVTGEYISGAVEGSKAESPERNEAVSPSKGNMAKRFLKQAGRSAHGLKHVFPRKGKRSNSKEDSGSGSESAAGGSFEESDSSDEKSPSLTMEYTPTVEGIPTDSAPVFDHGPESPNPEEQNIEEHTVMEVSCQSEERDMASFSKTEECSNTEIAKEILETEKLKIHLESA